MFSHLSVPTQYVDMYSFKFTLSKKNFENKNFIIQCSANFYHFSDLGELIFEQPGLGRQIFVSLINTIS